jgi:anhydro-N-acetylmuramic acid kinase
MVYRVIGLMSGSSLDGLDIAFVQLDDSGKKWSYQVLATECVPYSTEMETQLRNAENLSALAYAQLHVQYGKWVADAVNAFIEKNQLWHQVQLIASHGHTTFHQPHLGFTGQLGCGATIAALTGINTISDLRAMDIALGGQGAPIVPMGEKLLFTGYQSYLNIGGIANISYTQNDAFIAYDVCAANAVLNYVTGKLGLPYDDGGQLAANGTVNKVVLEQLNQLPYYTQPFPKSLANNFAREQVLPLLTAETSIENALATYAEHIAYQIFLALEPLSSLPQSNLLVTGGGAFNTYLVQRISEMVLPLGVTVHTPDADVVMYKEAVIMALLGLLRWREENTTLHSATGASRSSIGGAVWMGQMA